MSGVRTETRQRLVVWARRGAVVLLAAQFVALCTWSAFLFSRFSITNDGALNLQGMYLISHGHLDPYSTIGRFPLWKDHFTLAWWPISLLDLVWPHQLLIMWLQDAGTVAGEAVAFAWMYRAVTGSRRIERDWMPGTLLAVGAVMLVANPWNYWSVSFDIHAEAFATPFILLAAFDLSRGRVRRAWLWVVITLLFGDVMASWVLGLALSAFVAAYFDRGKGLVRTGIALVAVGSAWLALTSVIGGTGSVLSATFGYLAVRPGQPPPPKVSAFQVLWGGLRQPTRALSVLWGHRLNVVADVAPLGWIGMLTPWTVGVPLVVLLTNNTTPFSVFSIPTFQSAPVYGFLAVGTVILLTRLAAQQFVGPARLRAWVAAKPSIGHWLRRGARWLVVLLPVVFVANVIAWAAVWLPPMKSTWVRISSSQAQTLASIERRIPPAAEVVASQGVVGRFADRSLVYDLTGGPAHIPVKGRSVWFVVLPNAGIETQSVSGALGTILQMARLHATPVVHSGGIYVFRWHRPPHIHVLDFPEHPRVVPAWAIPGRAGALVMNGPVSAWHTASNGKEGYIVAGDYWKGPRGRYVAGVAMASDTPTYLEVWNTNGNQLVARQEVPSTNGRIQKVSVPFPVTTAHPNRTSYPGWGPFSIEPVAGPPGQTYEVRVWTPAGGVADVYSASLSRK